MAKKKEIKDNSNSLKARLTDDSKPDMPPVNQPITEMLEINYMPYAMSVIVSRAIPEIDGFKPSHRKLLYTMYKMGLLTGNRTKSANVVGQTMKLNPHGDQAIYETMVRMTRGNASLLHPYVDSKGNFGKQYSRDMAYAAPRYTEVKLEKICEELFAGIDKNAVDMVDNYDGTLKEPVLLPATFPSLLVNSNQGIAVGMASNISSFNLKEVCEATIAYLKDKDADILEYMPAPDFSGGGQILYNREQMAEIYETGKGSITLRSKYTVDTKNNLIEITEIPYSTSSEAIIDGIADLVKAGKVREINDVRDETDLDGLKITIDCKRGTNHEELMKKLFRFTKLQDTFSCNFNILINGSPRVMGVKEIISEWLNWRRQCVSRELAFDLDKKKSRLHLLEGLEKILLDIDKAIAIIRNTELEEDVVPNLMRGFDIDKIQAEYVAEIKLRHLNREYILKRTAETDKLEKDIAELEEILGSDRRIKNIIIAELKEIIKKYGQPRRTQFFYKTDIEEVSIEEEVPDYQCKFILSDSGYFKKCTPQSLRMASDQKFKEGDFQSQEIDASNRHDLLFFTNSATVYKTKASAFSDTKASALGDYIPAVLSFDEGESVFSMVATTDYSGYLLFCFENGKVAKVPLSAYETKTNRKKLANAYSAKSRLVAMFHVADNANIMLRTTNGRAMIFSTALLLPKAARDTIGVQAMTCKAKSVVDRAFIVSDEKAEELKKYKSKTIPVAGSFAKDIEDPDQITF